MVFIITVMDSRLSSTELLALLIIIIPPTVNLVYYKDTLEMYFCRDFGATSATDLDFSNSCKNPDRLGLQMMNRETGRYLESRTWVGIILESSNYMKLLVTMKREYM